MTTPSTRDRDGASSLVIFLFATIAISFTAGLLTGFFVFRQSPTPTPTEARP